MPGWAERAARGAAVAAASLLVAQASCALAPACTALLAGHLLCAWCAAAVLCPDSALSHRVPAPHPAPQSALAGSFTFDELQAKSYLEVKGSTLANQCSSLR